MSSEDMVKLDKIEATYIRETAKAIDYNGNSYEATVYTRVNATRGPEHDKDPSERYLDIMIEGC